MRSEPLSPLLHQHTPLASARGIRAASSSRSFARTLARIAPSPSGSSHYVVKSGDTLSGIAATLKRRTHTLHSVSTLVTRLAAVNQLDDPDRLAVGQVLTLPDELASSKLPLTQHSASPPTASFPGGTYGQMILATAQQLQVDPALSLAVARAESGISAATAEEVVLDPRAVSQDGKSIGVFQLTHATGREQLQKLALRQAYNPLNPRQNIHLGVGYLKHLAEVFSTETTLHQHLRTTPGANPQEVRRLVIAAYNTGMGRVARAQAQVQAQGGDPARYEDVAPYLPRATQQYVERVERFAARGGRLDTVKDG